MLVENKNNKNELNSFLSESIENKKDYISLAEAAKHCSYSQDYLSLRARQGKLKATKLGRNWVTKKEWLAEYIKDNSDYLIENKTSIWQPINSNAFDKLLREVNLFDFQKFKIGYFAFVGITRNIFSDFFNYFLNFNLKQILSKKRLPKLKFSNHYSANQFLRSLNFSIILFLIFIVFKTLTPIALASYGRNEESFKKTLALMTAKISTAHRNTFQNITKGLIDLDNNLQKHYKKIPDNLKLFNSALKNNFKLVNNFTQTQLNSFDIFDRDRFNFSKLSKAGLNILAYSDATKVFDRYNDLVKPYSAQILGAQEFGEGYTPKEKKNDSKNIFSFLNRFLKKINFYRDFPTRFSKKLAQQSQATNLSLWKSVLGSARDILQAGETKYVYVPLKTNGKEGQKVINNYNTYTGDLRAGNTKIIHEYLGNASSSGSSENYKLITGPRGEKGEKGDRGERGETGPQGPPGSSSGGGSTTVVQGGDAYLANNNTWTATNIYTAQVLMQDLGVSRYLSSKYLSVADALSVQSDAEGGMVVNADATFNDPVTFNSTVSLASGLSVTGNLSVTGQGSFGTSVGIGTSTPSTALHVDSNSATTTAIITLENNEGDFQIFRIGQTPEGFVSGSVGDLAIDTVNGIMYIKNTGNNTNTGWIVFSSSASSGLTQIVKTTTSYKGSFALAGKIGYEAANNICDAFSSGSHFCRTDEIISFIASNNIAGFSGYGWIAEGPPGYTSNSNDCSGWTSDATNQLGAYWAYDANGGGKGWLVSCETKMPLSCCK